MRKVFTTGQVAKVCKVAPRTVSKWFDSGRLKGYRIPGSQDRRIPREQLISFLKEYNMPQAAQLEAEEQVTIMTIGLDTALYDFFDKHSGDKVVTLHAKGLFDAGAELGAADFPPKVIIIDTLLGTGQVLEGLRHIKAQAELSETMIIVIAGEDNNDQSFDGASEVLRRPFAAEELQHVLTAQILESVAA